MEKTIVRRPGVTLVYRLDGAEDAPPLLLCHSIGTTQELWEPQIAALARRFRVIRYDARGHGRSSVPRSHYTLADLGQDACAVMDAAGVTAAHTVGVSLGGQTAMWLAVNAPGRVRGLVLANTAARLGNTARWDERMAVVRADGMEAIADIAIPLWFSPSFRRRQPATVERFRRMVADCSPQGYLGGCRVLRDTDLASDLGRIRSRALVIAGDLDEATPVDNAEQLRVGIPRAKLLRLPAAHLSNVELPEYFTSAVTTFLSHHEEVMHA